MAPKKAPGRNDIPALILQQLSPQLKSHLILLYNACLDLRYCPEHFRQSNTVVLPKSGKKDYTKVKSYRPIALLNTLNKIIKSIIVLKLSYAVERYQLLPRNHLKERKRRSTEHVIHGLMKRVYQAWD